MTRMLAAVVVVAGCGFQTSGLGMDAGGVPERIIGPRTGDGGAEGDSLSDAPRGADAPPDEAADADSGGSPVADVGPDRAADAGGEDAADGSDACVPRFHGPHGPTCECPEGRVCSPLDAGCVPDSCGRGCGDEPAAPPGRCLVRCDCAQGQECELWGPTDACGFHACRADVGAAYCCSKPGCPGEQACQSDDGREGPGDGTRFVCTDVIRCPGDPRC